MNDSKSSPVPQPLKNSRRIALTGLLLGAVVMLTGLVLTVFYAYLVWCKVDSAGNGLDARDKEAMMSYFKSMNHLELVAVVTTLIGLAVVVASMVALSRKKK